MAVKFDKILGQLREEDGGGGGGTGPTGTPISLTRQQAEQLGLDNLIVSSQKYKITDYQTFGLTRMEQELVSGSIEELIVTGETATTFNKLASSVTYPDDIIYYDIAKRQITTSATMEIEGNAGLPPTIDNSSNVLFNDLVGNTFTLTYPYALDYSKQISIDLYNDFTGEQWVRNDSMQNLITSGDIIINDLGGNQYEMQILFASELPDNQLFDFANQIGNNWFFNIGVDLPVSENKGTIFYRYDPEANVEAKLGADTFGSIDTADFRAEIQRRYDMGSEGYVAPKNTDYSKSITGSWGTTTETYTVNPIDYTMLPSVSTGAKNITLVGGLSSKNITIMDEVIGFFSPASDSDSHYQGQCSGVIIEEGSINSVIVLNGQSGTTVTNNSSVSDIVYKAEFVGMRIINSNIINWITPDTGIWNGWKFDGVSLTSGISNKDCGAGGFSGGSLELIGGDYNGVNIDYLYYTGKLVIHNNGVLSDYRQAGFFFLNDLNKFIFERGATTNVFGTNSPGLDCERNNITFKGNVVNNIISKRNGSTGVVFDMNNNNILAGITGSMFVDVIFNDNVSSGLGDIRSTAFYKFFNNNDIDSGFRDNTINKGMSNCTTNNGSIRENNFLMEVDNQTRNVSWVGCLIETELTTTKTYTVAQTNEKITDREGSVLYKRSISGGALILSIVS